MRGAAVDTSPGRARGTTSIVSSKNGRTTDTRGTVLGGAAEKEGARLQLRYGFGQIWKFYRMARWLGAPSENLVMEWLRI